MTECTVPVTKPIPKKATDAAVDIYEEWINTDGWPPTRGKKFKIKKFIPARKFDGVQYLNELQAQLEADGIKSEIRPEMNHGRTLYTLYREEFEWRVDK